MTVTLLHGLKQTWERTSLSGGQNSPPVTNTHRNPHQHGSVVHRKPSQKDPACSRLGRLVGKEMKAPLVCLWKAANKPRAVVTITQLGAQTAQPKLVLIHGGRGEVPGPLATPAHCSAAGSRTSSHLQPGHLFQNRLSCLPLDQHPLPWVNSWLTQVSK